MPFVTRLPHLSGSDPYPGALLALDFAGTRRGPQYYSGLGVTTTDVSKIPGWTYTGGTPAGVGSYAARRDGSLQFFPSYTNLLLRSQEFDNASWVKADTTISADVTSAPDGTLTADKLAETATTNSHTIAKGAVTVTSGTAYTVSFYMKAAERTYAAIYDGITAKGKFFNLSAGTVGGNLVGAPDNATITSIGGGWYRCAVTITTASTSFNPYVFLSTDGTTFSYAGTSGSGIYLWGAQLELGSTASPYIPTTSAAVTVGTPRITDAGYLAEEARTNLVLNTATLSTQSVTVTAVAHTLSFYGTGTVTLTGVSTAGPLVGTGANNRVTLTFTPTAGSLTLTVSGSVTIAQLEAGSFATSPIPTTSVAVTRSAGVGANPWTTNSGTLFVEFVCPPIDASNSQGIVSLDNGTASNRIAVYYSTGGSVIAQIDTGGVSQATLNLGAVTPGTRNKVAVRLATNDVAASLNGGAVATDTSVTLPTVTTHNVGSSPSMRSMNASLLRDVFYAASLGNADLQAITTAGAY